MSDTSYLTQKLVALESVPCCHRLVVVGQNVIPYATQLLTWPEQRYCVTRKELLVLVEFAHHLRHYLLVQEFTLRTDHGSLVWLRNFKELEGQLARWLGRLWEYNFTVVHRQGLRHCNTDALPRIPCRGGTR